MESDFVKIKTFTNELDAELLKGQLKEEGIKSFIRKDDCGGMLPNLQISEGVHLLVRKEDGTAAKLALADLLKNFERHDSRESTWVCPNCEENLEPQFTDCWNCGTSRLDQKDI